MHILQCRTVAKMRRFDPVNQTKTDGCLTGLLTGANAELWPRFGPVNQTGCQSFVWLTGPKRGQSSAFAPVNRPVRHPSVFVWLTGSKRRILATVRHCRMCI
ncbi:hypothetical protein Hanom_Chr10g00958281 [Helianthus anomalus]